MHRTTETIRKMLATRNSIPSAAAAHRHGCDTSAKPLARAGAAQRRGGASQPMPRTLVRQRGITLIEIMVAVVLTAIGLLGLAGLQLRGIQVNQGSAMRSLAAIMAEDLADRMRSDYAALAAGSFIGTYTVSNVGSAPVASLNDWLYGLQSLPAGVASASTPVPCGNVLPCVQIQQLASASGNPPHPVQIQIWWNDARATAASTAGVAIAGSGVAPTSLVGTYKTVAGLTESY